jgi:hypothetical protein
MNNYNEIKKKLLKKYKNTCNLCSLKYDKYLYVFDNQLLCKACYMIKNNNLSTYNQFNIYYSNLTQKEIINKSVNYIKEFNIIPQPYEIDPNIMEIKLSIVEYFNVINSNNTPTFFNKFKLFFNSDFNFSFIDSNLFSFINEDENNISHKKSEKYNFNEEEKLFLSDYFSS